MRTVRNLSIENLERRRAPAAAPFGLVKTPIDLGKGAPAAPAWDHNPNMQDVYCITDPCPPVFDPGAAKDKLGWEWGDNLRTGWKHHDIQGLDAQGTDAGGYEVLTNVQKSKHDAAMAAIQNTR